MTRAVDQDRLGVQNALRFLWLEITAKCNLFCTHCYAESGPDADLYGSMTFSGWTCVMDEAATLGCRRIQFIGGEPTMHPRLPELLDHASCRGFDFVEVYTNATRISGHLLESFRRNGARVATSFYSDDPLVHEQVTQSEGSWVRTVDGIDRVLAAGVPLRVGVIETVQNLGHSQRATRFLRQRGVQCIGNDHQRGVGRAERHGQPRDTECYEELCGQCWKDKLCVTSSGAVFPCVFARATPLGDVKFGLAAILASAKLTDFRREVRTLQERRRAVQLVAAPHQTTGSPALPVDTESSGCSPAGCSPTGCSPAGCSPAGCSPSGCSPTGRATDGSPDGSSTRARPHGPGGILVARGELTWTSSAIR
jgi:MoaA/NifB/PqqE/SkfB family radical SAM enzyme